MGSGGRPWWELSGDSVRSRSWTELRDLWIQHVPIGHKPGRLPSICVEEMPMLQQEARSVLKIEESPRRKYLDDVTNLRAGLLLEAIAMLHKAANVVAAGQSDFGVGFRSWSVSTCYQAAFFAMKALCRFMGVFVATIDETIFVVDACADEKSGRRSDPKQVMIYGTTARGRPPHQPLWYLFQRLLRVTAVPSEVWPREWVGALKRLDATAFARQRNDLHYRANAWPFDGDIRALVPVTAAGYFSVPLVDALEDGDGDEFPAALCFVLTRMASQLLASLAIDIAFAKDEELLLSGWQACPPNAFYAHSFSA